MIADIFNLHKAMEILEGVVEISSEK